MPTRIAAGLLLALPLWTAAAPFDGSQTIDAYNGLVVSFSRATALAGAYAGVAEGLDGAVFNPASVAHRNRNLDSTWDYDLVFNWLIPGVDLPRQDLGNEGRPDPALTGRGSLQLGLGLQVGRLGLGLLIRAWSMTADGAGGEQLELSTQDASLSAGWSFWREQLVLGADIVGVLGQTRWGGSSGGPSRQVQYSGAHLRAGALYKPRGSPWRLGLMLDPGQHVLPSQSAPPAPVQVPRAFGFPWVISLGGSMLLGRNALLYNEPPPVALREHPEWKPGPAYQGQGREPVLLTAQIDLAGRVPGAVSPLSYLHQQTEAAIPSGAHVTVEPHLGAEWTAIDRWLVIRGGSYLEPSRAGAGPRPHFTFGAQGRIPLWSVDLKASFAADLASRFTNVSLGIGFWHDLTPRAPRP